MPPNCGAGVRSNTERRAAPSVRGGAPPPSSPSFGLSRRGRCRETDGAHGGRRRPAPHAPYSAGWVVRRNVEVKA